MLLQENLSRLMECSVVDYREQICQWLQDNVIHVPMIEKWLAIWGLNLQEYLGILGSNGASDGLEVWAASLVINQPLNVVMADSVWCTAHDDLDFLYLTIMLISFECGMFCALDEQEQGELMQAAGPPTPTVKVVAGPRKGRPLMSIPEYLPQVDLD